jgi:hypothetical protein
MVASTWITPGGLQFFEERKTFSHGLGQSLPGRADSSSSYVRDAPKAEVSKILRLLETVDAQQNFEPFRLDEACD